MKSHRTSVGKKFPAFLSAALSLGLTLGACTIVQKPRDGGTPASAAKTEAAEAPSGEDAASTSAGADNAAVGAEFVPGEISIREDIETVEELRKNIPEQKRRENDALKEILGLLGEVKHPPEVHRDKFQRVMRNMREQRRRQAAKARDNFNKRERKEREAFQKALKDEREKFMKKKHSREERKEFFDEQDAKRREYFANERDARREFESEMRQQEADFNAFYREKNDEFNKELRNYSQRYREWQQKLREQGRERSRTGAHMPGPAPLANQNDVKYEQLGTGDN